MYNGNLSSKESKQYSAAKNYFMIFFQRESQIKLNYRYSWYSFFNINISKAIENAKPQQVIS